MYKVITLEEAYNDIENIYNYISLKSKNISIWKEIADMIFWAINSLNFLPYRYQKSFNNIRKLNVKSYSIFYIISEDTKEVIIIRILWTSMDYSQIFNQNDF